MPATKIESMLGCSVDDDQRSRIYGLERLAGNTGQSMMHSGRSKEWLMGWSEQKAMQERRNNKPSASSRLAERR